MNYMNNNQHDALSSVFLVITPLQVSGISAAHHQELECMYVANETCYTIQLTVNSDVYQVPFATYIHSTS
jgi:hypothetical protein